MKKKTVLTEPEDRTIRIGNFKNKKRFGDLSDKQLKNIAHWNELTKEEKKNVKKNEGRIIAGLTIPSSILGGYISKKSAKGALIGGSLGAASGSIMAALGRKKHSKDAKAAEEVLKKRQKEFGWATSKLIRPLKAKVGRARKKTAEKLVESASKNDDKKSQAIESFRKSGGVSLSDPRAKSQAKKVLLEENPGMIEKITKDSGGSYYNRAQKKINISPEEATADTLFHEIGHAKIVEGKAGRISKKLDSINQKSKQKLEEKGGLKEIKNIILTNTSDRYTYRDGLNLGVVGRKAKSGIESVKDLGLQAKKGISEYLTERKASKIGFKDLRKAGFTKKELKEGMKRQKAANNTYKHASLRDVKTRLANVVNIPSRRAGY